MTTQTVLAGLLVVAAAIYASWRLVPAQWQLQMLKWAERMTAKSAALAPLRHWVEHELAKRQSASGGCGNCRVSLPRDID